MLASKSPYSAPFNSSGYLAQNAAPAAASSTGLHSPTESDFSVGYEEPDSVFNWDERGVADWLKNIGFAQYVDVFLDNNITGENLVDLNQSLLKEMGVKRVGDRVKIASRARSFRFQEYRRRRETRDSLVPEARVPTPPLATSPRPSRAGGRSATVTTGSEKRTPSESGYANNAQQSNLRSISRPTSPMYVENHSRDPRPARVVALSPREHAQREQQSSYFSLQPPSRSGDNTPGSARTPLTARPPGTFASRQAEQQHQQQPRSSRHGQSKSNELSVDTNAANKGVYAMEPWVRVIYDDGRQRIFNIEGIKSSEELVLMSLRKGMLNESHVKSYCFYVLEGSEPDSRYCRRLSDAELMRICNDPSRKERERLLFRKIHTGEPDGPQLDAAVNLGNEHSKIEKLTGQSLPSLVYPMSPDSLAERKRQFREAEEKLERPAPQSGAIPRPRKRLNELHGARPPSEKVVADWKTYFPDVDHDELDKTMRMSIRRSQRLSRATSRLSTVSNMSIESILADAPPLPAISDRWLNGQNTTANNRPLSIVRMGSRSSHYRSSIASSLLDPLDEESPIDNHQSMDEPNRESYISFVEDPAESTAISATDHSGDTILSYSDEGRTGSSFNEQLSRAIQEDGEEADVELTNFLESDSWDDVKYLRGKLIGQGSFGSVYLALHAITGELMAVKQVELPSTSGTAVDAKKNNMVEALKREIALLRELKHPHIVQYLGSSSDANNLNIFLEYIPGGSIAKMLVEYGSLNENLVANFVRQILVGLAFLHSKEIIHRDIKGANILVDNHGSVKISDFGISKRVQDSKNMLEGQVPGTPGMKGRGGIQANRVSLQGSVFWMAPEVVKQTSYTRKADIWSLGCLIVEMLTGNRPHPNMSQLQAIFKIGGKGMGGAATDPSPEVPAQASKEAKEFLKKTFAIEYDKRPDATDLLEEPFLKQK